MVMGENMYQKINGNNFKSVWVVGDLHGCYSLLKSKLKEVGFNFNEDLLISVGDLVDRGNESIECLQLLTEKWFRSVKGNHEEMLLQCLVDNYAIDWMHNGVVGI